MLTRVVFHRSFGCLFVQTILPSSTRFSTRVTSSDERLRVGASGTFIALSVICVSLFHVWRHYIDLGREGCIAPWCMRRREDKARDARGAWRDAATWHYVATDDVLRATGPLPQQAVFVLAPLLSILLACPQGLLGYSLLSTATNHGKSFSVTRYLRAQKVKLISG